MPNSYFHQKEDEWGRGEYCFFYTYRNYFLRFLTAVIDSSFFMGRQYGSIHVKGVLV